MNLFLTTFLAIFLAELGDKTQLSTLLFASGNTTSKWMVFLGAALALVTSSALAVLLGSSLTTFINPKLLQTLAGGLFILIGFYTIIKVYT